jgi:hypothetical protein
MKNQCQLKKLLGCKISTCIEKKICYNSCSKTKGGMKVTKKKKKNDDRLDNDESKDKIDEESEEGFDEDVDDDYDFDLDQDDGIEEEQIDIQ